MSKAALDIECGGLDGGFWIAWFESRRSSQRLAQKIVKKYGPGSAFLDPDDSRRCIIRYDLLEKL